MLCSLLGRKGTYLLQTGLLKQTPLKMKTFQMFLNSEVCWKAALGLRLPKDGAGPHSCGGRPSPSGSDMDLQSWRWAGCAGPGERALLLASGLSLLRGPGNIPFNKTFEGTNKCPCYLGSHTVELKYKMMHGNYQEFPGYSWGVNGTGEGHRFSGPTAVA